MNRSLCGNHNPHRTPRTFANLRLTAHLIEQFYLLSGISDKAPLCSCNHKALLRSSCTPETWNTAEDCSLLFLQDLLSIFPEPADAITSCSVGIINYAESLLLCKGMGKQGVKKLLVLKQQRLCFSPIRLRSSFFPKHRDEYEYSYQQRQKKDFICKSIATRLR